MPLNAYCFVLVLVYPFVENHVGYFTVLSSALKAPGYYDLDEILPVGNLLDQVVLLSDLVGSEDDCAFYLLEGVGQLVH